ncbi:MAG: hypothetical protein R3A47_05645 [Polyangiales bacterium]
MASRSYLGDSRWRHQVDFERARWLGGTLRSDSDKSEKMNLKDKAPELYEKLKEDHERWQKNELKKKPLWPRIMDKHFVIDGKDYYFPA